jgi:antitoxin (DNA-binding transcriptional repressor) of toxin-antitoxin stability system
MTDYKMAYAKTHLASLIREALAGEEIVIARDDEPLVRLVPVAPSPGAHERVPGDLAGQLALPDALFAPLSDADASDWEG